MIQPSTMKRPAWPPGWWWAILTALLVGAGVLRYAGYDFSLPYVDHPDEPALTTAADSILTIGTAAPIHHLDAYPPGIVTLDYFLLRWFHNPTEPPTTILSIVRLLSITATIGIAVLIALLGYRSSGTLAGLLAAGLWGAGTTLVEYSRYGTADNFTALFAILAILLTSSGTAYSRNRLHILGVISLIVAIVFKYQAIFVTPVVFLVPLWRLSNKEGEERRAVLINYIDSTIIFGVFMFWLIMLTPMLGARQMAGWDDAYAQQLGLPTLERLYGTLQVITSGYSPILVIAGLLGMGVYIWPHARQHISPLNFGATLASALLWIVGISCFGIQGIRQSITAVALLAVLIGTGLSGWVFVLQALISRIGRLGMYPGLTRISRAVLSILVILFTLPQILGSIANALEHTLPDRRNDLALWFETTLEPGWYIADKDNHKTFERYWGGFPGQKHFPLFAMEIVTQRPLQEWRDKEVLYAIVPYDAYQEFQTTAEGQDYLDQMVLLKSYPPDSRYRGPSMVVFRVYPMQSATAGQLGPVEFLGYDIDRTMAASGESLTVRYYWRAAQPTDISYKVFNHILSRDSAELVAQQDGFPLDVSRPTTSWDDPSEIILSQPFSITIGEEIPAGEYRLVTGFYPTDTGQRLTSPTGDSFLTITTIHIE